jgi:predicted nucleotidyltransferase
MCTDPAPNRGALQRTLRRALSDLVNKGRGDVRHVTAAYEAFSRTDRDGPSQPISLHVDAYAGANPHVRRMALNLERVRGDLVGAYVHGSLATGDETSYSDFDALVVITAEVIRTPARLSRLARHLYGAQRIMFDADPLQHHGWFVLTEPDLAFYDDAYFPTALFAFCRLLLFGQGQELNIRPRDCSIERRMSLLRVAGALRRTIETGRSLESLYSFKRSLSQFMLLPALYVQARDGRGIAKQDGFDEARRDFTPDEWRCMDVASNIRAAWNYDISSIRRQLVIRPGSFRSRLHRYVGPLVSEDLRSLLSNGLLAEMVHLATGMCRRLGLDPGDEAAP